MITVPTVSLDARLGMDDNSTRSRELALSRRQSSLDRLCSGGLSMAMLLFRCCTVMIAFLLLVPQSFSRGVRARVVCHRRLAFPQPHSPLSSSQPASQPALCSLEPTSVRNSRSWRILWRKPLSSGQSLDGAFDRQGLLKYVYLLFIFCLPAGRLKQASKQASTAGSRSMPCSRCSLQHEKGASSKPTPTCSNSVSGAAG